MNVRVRGGMIIVFIVFIVPGIFTAAAGDSGGLSDANSQSGKTPAVCTPEDCDVPIENDRPGADSSDKLNFRLHDSYGRVIDSADYEGLPVLVMSGSCWCGGCQQDSELLREISQQYGPRGLAVVRTVAGDNELAALDFQKHYRLGFPQLMDTNRKVEKMYNRAGWTFLMLADHTGKVVYKANVSGSEAWQVLREKLDEVLAGVVSKKTVTRDSIAYMTATVERSGEVEKGLICERFPSIACGPAGKVCVVFASSGDDSDDVFARVFDGKTWSGNIPIAATDADEYDGTVLFDKLGRIQVCWTSNAGGRNYDIFVTSFTDRDERDEPVRVTHSDDDAMHGRMVCDRDGRIWLVYYKWRKMRGRSRDREIYVRRFDDSGWSAEIQVSPTDVPEYEDHTDPSIAAAGNSAVIVWSWDFHPPNKGYSRYAEMPTIFMRPVMGTMDLGEVSSVSGKNIDSTPTVAVTENKRIWCAWDSIDRSQRKTVFIANPRIGADMAFDKMKPLSDVALNVCGPYFVESNKGDLTVLWCETADGRNWKLKRSELSGRGEWAKPLTMVSKDNPRYCGGAYDEQNRLWVCYTIETQRGREVVVEADSNGAAPGN